MTCACRVDRIRSSNDWGPGRHERGEPEVSSRADREASLNSSKGSLPGVFDYIEEQAMANAPPTARYSR